MTLLKKVIHLYLMNSFQKFWSETFISISLCITIINSKIKINLIDFSKFKDINHQSEVLFTFKNYAFKKLDQSHKADVI
jgi:hypothetical protein